MLFSRFIHALTGIFSSKKEMDRSTLPQDLWFLAVSGKISKLHKTDIDKSGKNPTYLIYGSLQVVTYQLNGADFEIPASIDFQAKEKDLIQKTAYPFVIDQEVSLHFSGTAAPQGRFIFS